MESITIDLSPQVRHYDGHGRKELTKVYYRVDVRGYTGNLYIYTEAARRESNASCAVYFDECVKLLEADGWQREEHKYDPCPTMRKGLQRLRCHPQEIVGEVESSDVERIGKILATLTTAKYYRYDSYENVVVTTSPDDTMTLYHQSYDDTIMDTLRKALTTRRRTHYHKLEVLINNLRSQLLITVYDRHNDRFDYEIGNTKKDLDGRNYASEDVCTVYLREKVRQAIAEGNVVTTIASDGYTTIGRWLNKAEQRKKMKN